MTPLGVDVKEFGAVGDWDPVSRTGTDDTAAVQAALDAVSGSGGLSAGGLWWSPGRYLIKDTLTLGSNTVIQSTGLLNSGSVNNAVDRLPTMVLFDGPDGAPCFHATAQQKILLSGLRIQDIRQGATSGDGVLFENVLNGAQICRCDVRDFPGAGIRIKRDDTTKYPSDCVLVDDVWLMSNGTYGLDIADLDHTVIVRHVKGDTRAGSTMRALIRCAAGDYQGSTVTVEHVKHEVRNGASTIFLDTLYGQCNVRGVVQRLGPGGPVVDIQGNVGSMVVVQGISGKTGATGAPAGQLLRVGKNVVAGTRLPLWIGGADGIQINGATIRGQYDSWQQMTLTGSVTVAGRVGFYGQKPALQPTLTYSRATETPAEAQLRAALTTLGLITDRTIP